MTREREFNMRMQKTETTAQSAEAKAAAVEAKIDELDSSSRSRRASPEQPHRQRIDATYASTSWRVTKLLRKLARAMRSRDGDQQLDYRRADGDPIDESISRRDSGMQSMDDFLFPGVRRDKWQMMPWERIALTGVLARIRPALSLEVGVYYGGSLTLTSQFVERIVAIDIDRDTTNRFTVPANAEVIIGDSRLQIPRLLKRFEEEGKALEFVLIDADHSAEGVRRDIELILEYRPVKPMIILAHDSANQECRRGMKQANWQANPYVHELDLDFVPGQIIEHSIANGKGEVWGGFAIAYLHPEPRRGALTIRESARSSLRSIHHCCSNLSAIPAID